jgi:urease accessory protein
VWAPVPRRGVVAAGTGEVRACLRVSRTVLRRAYATSPLRLLTPRNHGHATWVYTSSFGGGFVDGDRVALDVDVEPGAALFLSSQSSTKVYRSVQGSHARLDARVANDSLLVVAADPVVLFAQARFDQRQTFEVASGGRLVVVDWMTSGRRESGERWAFTQYANRLDVRLGGARLVYEVMRLSREDGELALRLGRFDVLAFVVIAGTALASRTQSLLMTHAHEPVRDRPEQLCVAAPLTHPTLGPAGCVLRIAGRTVDDVGRTIRSALGFVPGLLGDDPWARKW